jgi:hypothetical protein
MGESLATNAAAPRLWRQQQKTDVAVVRVRVAKNNTKYAQQAICIKHPDMHGVYSDDIWRSFIKKIVRRRLIWGTTIFQQDIICGVSKQSRNGGPICGR